jgi:hypothetical protein
MLALSVPLQPSPSSSEPHPITKTAISPPKTTQHKNRANNPQAVQPFQHKTSIFPTAESSLTLQTSRVDSEPHVESEEASEGLTFLEGFPYSYWRLRKSRKCTSNRASLGSEDCENRELWFLNGNKTHGSTRRSMSEQIIPDCLHRADIGGQRVGEDWWISHQPFERGPRGDKKLRGGFLCKTLKRTFLDELGMKKWDKHRNRSEEDGNRTSSLICQSPLRILRKG